MRPDLLDQLRARMPAAAPVLEALEPASAAWLVGGTVRDLLLEREPRPEIDIAIADDPQELSERLAREIGGTARTHGRFGTASVFTDGLRVDVARTRAERYSKPGALPDVRPAPLAEDLARRDFSVNAIALGLDGTVTAVPHALEDLASRRLRVLHAASFRDDPIRLLRMVRYAARLGFEAEEQTARLAIEAARSGALVTTSTDRIAAELALVANEDTAPGALQIANSFEILTGIGAIAAYDAGIFETALELLPDDGRRESLVVGLLARGLDPRAGERFVEACSLDAPRRDAALAVCREADVLADGLAQAPERPSAWATLARGRPLEAVAAAGALGPVERARRWLEHLRSVRLEIDGNDLISAGVAEGPSVGRGLQRALGLRLDGRLEPGRDAELRAALEEANSG